MTQTTKMTIAVAMFVVCFVCAVLGADGLFAVLLGASVTLWLAA